MKRVLQIGPSVTRAKGGMSTVIKNISQNGIENYEIENFSSYIDGNIIVRVLYSIYAFVKFIFIYKKFDIFHIHVASGNSTRRKAYYIDYLYKKNKDIILHIHGSEYKKFWSSLGQNEKEKIKSKVNKANSIICLSNEWYRYFENIFDKKKLEVVMNGVDLSIYEKIETENNSFLGFLFLGRLGERKGIYDLIEAMNMAIKENPNLYLFVLGDGEVEKVQRIIDNKGLNENIKVLGWCDLEETLSIFPKIDTLILPSYNEGLPMSILETMASSKVIISTRVGGIPELIGKDNGILINPGDVEALTKAILRVSRDAKWREGAKLANKKLVRDKYSLEAMCKVLKSIYDGL